MHNPLLRFWFDCLAGRDTAALAERAGRLTPADWQELDTLTQRHQLTPMLYWRLRESGAASAVPSPLRGEWQQTYYASVRRSILCERDLGQVLAALARTGVSPILFKGSHLAFWVYPAAACRPMNDLDLWVTRAEVPRAQAALEQLGYVRDPKGLRVFRWQGPRDGEIHMLGQKRGQVSVDLHWGVFHGEWLHRTTQVDRAGVEARARTVTLAGCPARVLEPADALIQIAVHLATNHYMSGSVLRSLLDVVALAQEVRDWNDVAGRAVRWRVANTVGLVLATCDALIGLPEARSAVARLRPSALRRTLIQPFVNPASVLAARNLRTTRLRWLFLFALADRPLDALRLLFRLIWPEDASLRILYGRSTWRVRAGYLLRPFVRRIRMTGTLT